MTTPGLTQAQITAVAHAAIEAAMYEQDFSGSVASGSFLGKVFDGTDFVDVTVSYPGGQATTEFGASVADSGFSLSFDPASLFATWTDRIQVAFENWIDVPEPSAFDAQIERLRTLFGRLDLNGQTQERGDGTGAHINVADRSLPALVDFPGSTVPSVGSGEAWTTFEVQYAQRIPSVFAGLGALVALTGVLVTGEQQTWQHARADIVTLADQAQVSFHDLTTSGSADWQQILEVGGVILDVVTVFAPELGVPAKTAEMAGIVDGVLGKVAGPGSAKSEGKLSGGTADAVYESLLDSLTTLRQAVAEQETGFRDAGVQAQNLVNAEAAAFILGRADRVGPADGSTVSLPSGLLDQIAARFEAIAHVLAGVGAELAGPGSMFAWNRYSGIGIGPDGHYSEYASLHETLHRVISANVHQFHHVAELLVELSHHFTDTDDRVQETLDRLVKQIPSAAPKSTQHHQHF